MAARAGCANLILRLRALTETAASDYTASGQTWWTDNQLQDILDANRTDLEWVEPTPLYEYLSGATIWRDYDIGYPDLEEVASAAPYWSLVNNALTEVASADYEVDYIAGRIRFDSNTSGAVYFLKARSYNLNRAAVDVWQAKLAHVASAYDFSTEGQSFSRSQMSDKYRAMIAFYQGQAGMVAVPFNRSDLY